MFLPSVGLMHLPLVLLSPCSIVCGIAAEQLMASCKRLTVPALAIVMLTCSCHLVHHCPKRGRGCSVFSGIPCSPLSFAVLLAASLGMEGPIKRLLTSRILMFLGRRCYGLYLWHVLAAALP